MGVSDSLSVDELFTLPNMKSFALLLVAAAMWSQVMCRPQWHGLGGFSNTQQQLPGSASNVQSGNAGGTQFGASASNTQAQTAQGGASTSGVGSSTGLGGLYNQAASVNNQAQSNSQPGFSSTQQQHPGLGGIGGYPGQLGGYPGQLGGYPGQYGVQTLPGQLGYPNQVIG